jgi:hypothetical protein
LHSTLPGLPGFARNDIPDRSFNRIEVPLPLQLPAYPQVRTRCRSHGAGESPK